MKVPLIVDTVIEGGSLELPNFRTFWRLEFDTTLRDVKLWRNDNNFCLVNLDETTFIDFVPVGGLPPVSGYGVYVLRFTPSTKIRVRFYMTAETNE